MNPDWRTVIERLHARQRPGVLAVTGGGASLLSALLTVPGASRTVLEAVIPYAESALVDWLGFRPDSFCVAETARAMADRAWEHARRLAPDTEVFGLGCTASLATDRPKKGEHRAYVALRTMTIRQTLTIRFEKGLRDRIGEEDLLVTAMLRLLDTRPDSVPPLPLLLSAGDSIDETISALDDPLAQLLDGRIARMMQTVDGQWLAMPDPPRAFLSGSFHPLHDGHRQLVEVAEQKLGLPVGYELSIRNADKPSLDRHVVERRLRQFVWHRPIWLSREPYFVDKSAIYPGAVMIVGVDTAARLLDPKYTQGDLQQRDAALQRVADHQCRFLVAGRVAADGRFQTLDSLAIPDEFRSLFLGLSESEFRLDRSSTEIRNRGGTN
ncbi:hypothetical protein [Tuwongella immobilis]|uniref:Cytidyltransferase-like domain-containing protein n=1 Tax=Tuwongella immobilis TaxID=692036 RepID=A0A6C2YN75_9BACT|nr:hypothetical protein [Tuwongella immobilis]VIP02827.1 Uncharacterized protein OS=Phaseolus vulgaris GN=PHAVU_007G032000g PE=4 SV=1 [Tuwongella immobilis]VTS02569.1 Uncharacterized protein OS=Phaseolus vulgaris GN=PHAVU_007G032000g PE=4 SV=1 [Tuwongella immobilis]